MKKNNAISPEKIGVVISTYNNPAWLEKTLWGFENQTVSGFEIIISDDGSGDETKELIRKFQNNSCLRIKHVWQDDEGFQKSRILNKAIMAAESEYLIFTDQDCIPRKDFVETHIKYAEKGYFLSAGYFRLPMSISKSILEKDISSQQAFNLKWLKNRGLKINFKCTKLFRSHFFSSMMNFITPAKSSWNGCNSSGWKADFLKINGFNEEMHYGGQDREFGERLSNLGIKSKQIRYSAICLHLDHKRPYKTPETLRNNREIRKNTRRLHIVETPAGIRKPDKITKS